MDTYSLYAIYAAMEALENSGLNMEEEDRDRVGVIVSSGIGGLKNLKIKSFVCTNVDETYQTNVYP